MTKQFLSVFLIFCLLAPATGTFLWLQYRKKIVRKEVKHKLIEGVNNEELVFFKFSKEDSQKKLRWEHSKEFEFENNMYDIVRQKTVGDTIQYWVWWDYEETLLNKQLHDLALKAFGEDSQNKEKQTQLIDFLKTDFIVNSNNYYSINTTIVSVSHNFCYSANFSSLTLPPLLDPPELG